MSNDSTVNQKNKPKRVIKEEQLDMLGIDDVNNNIAAHLDSEITGDLSLWEQGMVELYDIAKQQLKEMGIEGEQAEVYIKAVIVALSIRCGGRGVYLPMGKKIKNALQHKKIYDAYTGNNIAELCKRFKMSEPNVYAIVKEQRQIAINRRQHSIFN